MHTVLLPTPALVAQFQRAGFLVAPDVLSPAEVAKLRAGIERVFSTPSPEAALYHSEEIWRPRMFEQGEEFEALIDHPGVAQFIDHLLGEDCHIIANNALRTTPGKTISGWHADECVRFPIPREVMLDPRIEMPPYIINTHYYLADVDEEVGPTQFIPGSHRSGRMPDATDMDADGNPAWNGQGVVSATGQAGTCVLWNDQVWHRGGPNVSNGRIRWAVQKAFARRWISQRFYPFVNYRMPEAIIARATPRRKRLLGFHGIGAYG
ncbi:MAG: phytanoyl-CoA dioxygenase family protein [Opitutaceae bacterium]|nr:phytanoyl-CoA dioxygenase family protein [Opitutaceae bacterium]